MAAAFFSPDGKQIVWRAAYPVTAADTADYRRLLAQRLVRPAALELWVANADGSGAREITHLGGANWAPFFFPTASGSSSRRTTRIRTAETSTCTRYVPTAPGSRRSPRRPSSTAFPMFSPDGRKLVWVSSRHSEVPGEINLFIADWKD